MSRKQMRESRNTRKQKHNNRYHGRQAGGRAVRVGGTTTERVDFVGVSDRKAGDSLSARRINCRAVRGDPGVGGDPMDLGLLPLGVDKAKDGMVGSGVRGTSGMSGVSRA